jgi:hypothetical protein
MKEIVKILGVLIIVLLTTLSVNAQVEALLKERAKEMEAAEELAPRAQEQRLKEINAFYKPLIAAAIEKEEEKKEKEKKERERIGGSLEFEGDRGSYQGRSLSVKRGSEAYSTVVQADANAHLVRSMANGNSTTIKASSVGSVGLEGVVANRYNYGNREIKITIEGINVQFRKTFLLRPGQEVTEFLLPGDYNYTIVDGNYTPKKGTFSVLQRGERTNKFGDRDVFWFVAGGRAW